LVICNQAERQSSCATRIARAKLGQALECAHGVPLSGLTDKRTGFTIGQIPLIVFNKQGVLLSIRAQSELSGENINCVILRSRDDDAPSNAV
jgi:hypothetical protein